MSHTRKSAPKLPAKWRIIRNGLLLLAVLVAAYGVLPQIGSFKASFMTLRTVSVTLAVLALVLNCGAYLMAAASYCLLALKPIAYGSTLVVQLANLLVNRIVPGGIGGLGLNYKYLRTKRHTADQALVVVTFNTVVGFGGNILGLLVIVLWAPSAFSRQFRLPAWQSWWLIVLIGLVVAAALGSRIPWLRTRITAFRASLRGSFRAYRRRPWRIVLALISSLILALCNAASFWLCCRATGLAIAFATAFIVFSLSVVIGTLTPTPGGLGGVEAGLVAGLVAARVPAEVALATALLYRLLSYWLPLLFGAGAFLILQRRHYVRWSSES